MALLFSGYVDNLHKPDYKVVLLHVMENLKNVKDMSKLSIYDTFRKIIDPKPGSQNSSSASLGCRNRQLYWVGPSEETAETEALCHSRCGTIKIPPRSKVPSILGINFHSFIGDLVTSPNEWFFFQLGR